MKSPIITRHHVLVVLIISMYSIEISSCKKFIELQSPPTQILSNSVFENDNTANAAVAGMYSYMYQLNNANSTFGGYHLTICNATTADEMYTTGNSADPFLTNNLFPDNNDIDEIWSSSYRIIYNANAIIEGLQQSTNIAIPLKNQLMGEALFIRSFCHFYLVNLFGDIPLVTVTDLNITQSTSRTPSDSVYKKIISDLLQAQNLLANDYAYSANERVRANKWVATAMLARVYLYTGDWKDAELQASQVIGSTGLYSLLPDLNTVYLKNSNEAIWQFLSFGGDGHTTVGNWLIPAPPTVPPYALDSFLLYSFEANDARRLNWVDSTLINGQTYFTAYKYKNKLGVSGSGGEYDMVLRLAEQYLIRAEARAQQENLGGALSDLNIIRERANLPDTVINDQATTLSAIMQERRIEFFCEWGHRWLDLKRTKTINAVLSAEKPTWSNKAILFPIPQQEIASNPNLTQNPGY